MVRSLAGERWLAAFHAMQANKRIGDSNATFQRRILTAISNTMDIGDVTTLANPEIVEAVRVAVCLTPRRCIDVMCPRVRPL